MLELVSSEAMVFGQNSSGTVVAVHDQVEMCSDMVASKNVIYTDLQDPEEGSAPLLLSKIVANSGDGICAIPPWGLNLVVSYRPSPGFLGMDRCVYEACEDLDRDGEIGNEEANGRCTEATLRIVIGDCEMSTPTDVPTPMPTQGLSLPSSIVPSSRASAHCC